MLGAIVILLLLAAAVYAATTVGGAIALVFVAAVLFLAYKRLSLLTFTATFTVLLARLHAIRRIERACRRLARVSLADARLALAAEHPPAAKGA